MNINCQTTDIFVMYTGLVFLSCFMQQLKRTCRRKELVELDGCITEPRGRII
jgi:hypothetical protein